MTGLRSSEGEPALHFDAFSPVFAAVLLGKRSGQGITVLHDDRGVRQSAMDADADHSHAASDVEAGLDRFQVDPLRDPLQQEAGAFVDIETAEEGVGKAESQILAAESELYYLVDVGRKVLHWKRHGGL